jgi:catalase
MTNQFKSMTNQSKSMSEERGKRLGFLIAALEMSAEQREALFSLLPEMTEAQLEELTDVLEASYLQAATKDVDEKFVGELKNIEENYEEKIGQVNANTAKELDSIS